MKLTKIFLIILAIFILFSVWSVYVYVGTYVLPIAPHWVTQLPPNPPKPEIKYGEFKFKMTYYIDGKLKEISDVIVCEFKGFEVRIIGDSKKGYGLKILKTIILMNSFIFEMMNEKITKGLIQLSVLKT